jgi:hypothetical protein
MKHGFCRKMVLLKGFFDCSYIFLFSIRCVKLAQVFLLYAVFTVPHELNPFALRNKKCFYDLLFRAVKETILELAANPKRLGADIGVVAVLHTWGQALTDHPHIHCIVTGGGYNQAVRRWKPCSNGFPLSSCLKNAHLPFAQAPNSPPKQLSADGGNFIKPIPHGLCQLPAALFNTAHPKRFRDEIMLLSLRIDRLVLGD